MVVDPWNIIELSFDPDRRHEQETVFTIGNGYLGTRGTFEEGFPSDRAATLVHGLFDDIPLVFTELVNAPNWLDFALYVNGQRFRLDQGRVLEYRRALDLRRGVLSRTVRWQSPAGETVQVQFERFASLADKHVLAIRVQAQTVDFAGTLEFRAGLPGHVDNDGWLHWNWVNQGSRAPQTAHLQVETKATRLRLAEACRLNVTRGPAAEYDFWDSPWQPTVTARCQVHPGDIVQAEKLVTIYTSRDTAEPEQAALQKLAEAAEQGYEQLLAAQITAWEAEWEASNIVIEGDDEADQAVRYSLFQLLIAAPRHDDRVSIAAKTLSGFGYRGHVFWDTEIFILPFFTYTRPQIARNLLMYRYHTLSGARKKAAGSGYEGAMYAWESAATGEEATPRWLPLAGSDQLVRIWCGDIEHHITADVAYAVHTYWRVTGDDEFMRDYGAEIMLDTARFWGSRVEWNAGLKRYEINDVIGPDEYHDHVDNNAYTNNLARWNIQAAQQVLHWLETHQPQKAAQLKAELDLTPERLEQWQHVVDHLYLAKDPETGLYEQFEGYARLHFQDLETYEPRKISMQALLGIEGVQETQFIKQPDVLMLLYLMDDPTDRASLQANWDYYTPRTDLTYGSSLGPAIQAALAARMRIGEVDTAYKHFIHAARTDLQNVRGNTADGIHAATAGGLWQAVVLGFAGLRIDSGQPTVDPNLPAHWRRLRFRIFFHSQPYDFDLHQAPQPVSGVSTGAGPRLPILGAIFDLDGVLTDTSEFHYLGWQRLADEEGLPFSRADNEALRGVSRRESLKRLLKGRTLPEEQMQELMERKNKYYQESITHLSPDDLLPGAAELLDEMRQSGLRIAIGSASKNAHPVVARLGILDKVDAISDGHSVHRQKPAPDLFLHAAQQLDLPPEQCIVFEDAEAGVAAALAGGMWAVGLGPPERVGAAHLVFPNLQNVTWQAVLARIEQLANSL